MMRFDRRRGAIHVGSGFNDIRVQCALCQKFRILNRDRFFLKDLNKQPPDDLPFLLWINDPFQFGKKQIFGIHHVQVGFEVLTKAMLYLICFPFTQQPVIYKDTRELRTDRPIQQRGDYRGIDSP